jgi:hypothetical protein
VIARKARGRQAEYGSGDLEKDRPIAMTDPRMPVMMTALCFNDRAAEQSRS